ncbi:MAG: hypothetical protein K0U84_02555 [Actinomycetia bacterium]|nr:hypothetical protein [Actinomycetes bacterium]
MSEPIRKALLIPIAVGVMVVMAACQSAQSPQETPAAESSSPATTSASSIGSAQTETVIDIAIDDGAVTPTNAQAQASVGHPVLLVVSSDAVDSLHVHSVPEQVFDIEARPDQRFEFTVRVPGRVDVELHNLHRTVVTIEVQR